MRANKLPVREQAMQLAELKAMRISAKRPGLVIGGDQMLALGDEAFDKPADLDAARNHLRQLSGKPHTLETAIVICEDGAPVWRHLARPKLTMRPLTEEFIDSYVSACGEALLSTVGAYQLEGPGAQLFTRIEGDYFSILGLPLLPLLDYLRIRKVLPT
jgi:septum formation protein